MVRLAGLAIGERAEHLHISTHEDDGGSLILVIGAGPLVFVVEPDEARDIADALVKAALDVEHGVRPQPSSGRAEAIQ